MDTVIHEKSDKHQRILDAALTLFQRKGYEPISLEEIAREAGIAKGTLYLYFRDKEDLFSSAVRHVLHSLEETMSVGREGSLDLFGQLERMVRGTLETFTLNRNFLGVFFILSNPTLVLNRQALFHEMMRSQQASLDRLSALLRLAQEGGQIKPGLDPRELASLFAGMVKSAIGHIGHAAAEVEPDIPRTVRTLMEVFRNGVEPPGTSPRRKPRSEEK